MQVVVRALGLTSYLVPAEARYSQLVDAVQNFQKCLVHLEGNNNGNSFMSLLKDLESSCPMLSHHLAAHGVDVSICSGLDNAQLSYITHLVQGRCAVNPWPECHSVSQCLLQSLPVNVVENLNSDSDQRVIVLSCLFLTWAHDNIQRCVTMRHILSSMGVQNTEGASLQSIASMRAFLSCHLLFQ